MSTDYSDLSSEEIAEQLDIWNEILLRLVASHKRDSGGVLLTLEDLNLTSEFIKIKITEVKGE